MLITTNIMMWKLIRTVVFLTTAITILMYSIIHPTRRLYQAQEAALNWLGKFCPDERPLSEQLEYIVSIDYSDRWADDYARVFEGLPVTIVKADNRSIVDAVNVGAKESTGDVLIVVSDDFDCPDNWNVLLDEAVEGLSDFVLKTNNDKHGNDNWLVTLPIMDRVYYNRDGYIYDPVFLHLFCDTAQTHKAALRGRLFNATHLTFHHDHPSKNKSEGDEINKKANKTWAQGEQIYLQQVRDNFGLGLHEIVGMIDNADHLRYLKEKGVLTV